MTSCLFCNGDHDSSACPMFGKTKEFLATYAPTTKPTLQEPSSSSLAPTQFEELFGRGAEPLLMDALDDPDLTAEQQELAREIAGGSKRMDELTPEDHRQLDEITLRLVHGGSRQDHVDPPPVRRRPAYVSTREEMENFRDIDGPGDPSQPAADPFTSVNHPEDPASEPNDT